MLSQQIERAIAEEAAIRSAATFKQLRIELIEAIDEVFDRITGTETKPEQEPAESRKRIKRGHFKRRWRSLPDALKKNILLDLAAGVSRAQIAFRRKIHVSTVDRITREAREAKSSGRKHERGKVSPEIRAQVIRDLQTDKQINLIARDAGLGRTSIGRIRRQWVQEEMEKKRRAEEERKIDTAQEMGQM